MHTYMYVFIIYNSIESHSLTADSPEFKKKNCKNVANDIDILIIVSQAKAKS